METVNALQYLLGAVLKDAWANSYLLLGAGASMVVWATVRFFLNCNKIANIEIPEPEEIKPQWDGPTVDSPELKGSGPDKIQCVDPATSQLLAIVDAMRPTDVADLVQKARDAQKDWALTSFAQRRKVLTDLNAFVTSNQDTICKVAARDSGKTFVDGLLGEVLTTCEKISWTVEHGEKVLKPEYRPVNWIMVHKHARVVYQPLGVVGAIVSWNYPFHNLYGPIISALFAGNAIVLKASEYVAWSTTTYFSRIIKEILQQNGHSPDLVQFVVGYADVGQELIKHVDKVTFIGSPAVGKLIMAQAAETLTPVVLELGGKDAAVVCDDCDFNQVIDTTMRGFFQNSGQNCIGLERVVVHTAIYDRYVAVMQDKIKALTQGPALKGAFDVGAMVMPASIAKIEALVDDAVAKGAKLLTGGKGGSLWKHSGQYFQPTMLVDVTTDMAIANEEVFGPVCAVFRYQDDAEALKIVNSCSYGLGANVFSLDKQRAERMAMKIMTGMVNINDFAVSYMCQSLPFGGVKISGFDRFAGPEGLRGNCLVKAVTSDRIPGVRTQIPPPLRYPMTAQSFQMAQGLVNTLYSPWISGRLNGIAALAGLKKSPAKEKQN